MSISLTMRSVTRIFLVWRVCFVGLLSYFIHVAYGVDVYITALCFVIICLGYICEFGCGLILYYSHQSTVIQSIQNLSALPLSRCFCLDALYGLFICAFYGVDLVVTILCLVLTCLGYICE